MRGPLRVISEMAQPVLWDLLLGVGWLWNLPILRKARRPWTGAVVLALCRLKPEFWRRAQVVGAEV